MYLMGYLLGISWISCVCFMLFWGSHGVLVAYAVDPVIPRQCPKMKCCVGASKSISNRNSLRLKMTIWTIRTGKCVWKVDETCVKRIPIHTIHTVFRHQAALYPTSKRSKKFDDVPCDVLNPWVKRKPPYSLYPFPIYHRKWALKTKHHGPSQPSQLHGFFGVLLLHGSLWWRGRPRDHFSADLTILTMATNWTYMISYDHQYTALIWFHIYRYISIIWREYCMNHMESCDGTASVAAKHWTAVLGVFQRGHLLLQLRAAVQHLFLRDAHGGQVRRTWPLRDSRGWNRTFKKVGEMKMKHRKRMKMAHRRRNG